MIFVDFCRHNFSVSILSAGWLDQYGGFCLGKFSQPFSLWLI